MGKAAFESKAHIIIISAINPYQIAKDFLLRQYQAKLVWISCGLNILKRRDTKGLYFRASLPDTHPDNLNNLTGVNDPFEVPDNLDLVIHADQEDAEGSALRIYDFILKTMEVSDSFKFLPKNLTQIFN